MAIQYTVRKIQDNGLRTSSYEVRMVENGVYKRAEMIVGQGEDAAAVAAARVADLWAGGAVVPAAYYLADRERLHRDFYIAVQVAMVGTWQAGGNLATVNAAGLQVIAADDDKVVEWQSYKTLIQNGGVLDERELHSALVDFVTLGRLAGLG